MAVAPPAKGRVLGLADGIALDRDPCPVVDCVAKAGVGGHAAHDKLVLAGSACDRRDGDGRGAEDLHELVGRDPPDPVALEQALEGPALDPPDLAAIQLTSRALGISRLGLPSHLGFGARPRRTLGERRDKHESRVRAIKCS